MKEKYVSLLTILIAVAVAFLIFYFRGSITPPGLPKPSTPAPDVARNTLLTRVKFSFPTVASSTAISSIKSLPAQLSVLIPADYTDASLKSVDYANGKKGYLVSYLVNQTMNNFLRAQTQLLSNNQEWQVKYSIYTDTFGFIELGNTTYQVRIEHSLTTDNKDQAVVRVLRK